MKEAIIAGAFIIGASYFGYEWLTDYRLDMERSERAALTIRLGQVSDLCQKTPQDFCKAQIDQLLDEALSGKWSSVHYGPNAR